jgi:hypothetical protein
MTIGYPRDEDEVAIPEEQDDPRDRPLGYDDDLEEK